MKEGYQDIVQLAGLVFVKRDFLDEVLEKGVEAVLEERGAYGDLTAEQQATFEDVIHHSRMQKLIREWWQAYDEERARGEIAKAGDPWEL
ncbi:MAG: hypothetical protein ACLFTI_11935 [Anaerolineales bacterium]